MIWEAVCGLDQGAAAARLGGVGLRVVGARRCGAGEAAPVAGPGGRCGGGLHAMVPAPVPCILHFAHDHPSALAGRGLPTCSFRKALR